MTAFTGGKVWELRWSLKLTLLLIQHKKWTHQVECAS